MKKVILGLVLATGLSFNASAAVGMLTGNCYISYTGLLAMKASVGYSVKAIFTGSPADWIKAAKIGLAGLIVLDNDGLAEFAPIHGNLEGVTAQEIEVYNSEVEEVNLITEEVLAQIDRDTTVDQAKELWKTYETTLSPETFKVMTRIVGE